MLKCLGCRRGSAGSDEEATSPSADDAAAAKTSTAATPSTAETPSDTTKDKTTTPTPTSTASDAADGADGPPRTRNLMGLRVDASVEAELADLGMDATALLEPLTPRSLVASTPYPGKRPSAVLDAVLGADGLLLLPDSDASSPSGSPQRVVVADPLPAMAPRERDGAEEPPATPVGRDELALRRHRFFADLLTAAQAAADHRVRFDPRGPVVAGGYLRHGLGWALYSVLCREGCEHRKSAPQGRNQLRDLEDFDKTT